MGRLKEDDMRVSKKGKSIYIEIGMWLDKDESIHVTSREGGGFHVGVRLDPKHRNGHPTLYKKLASLLREAGAPAPETPDD